MFLYVSFIWIKFEDIDTKKLNTKLSALLLMWGYVDIFMPKMTLVEQFDDAYLTNLKAAIF